MPASTTPRSASNAVYLHPSDNICVAARNLVAGDQVTAGAQSIAVQQSIKIGHKVAVRPIAKGDYVYKFGQIIGHATERIEPGQHLHSHNLENCDFGKDYAK